MDRARSIELKVLFCPNKVLRRCYREVLMGAIGRNGGRVGSATEVRENFLRALELHSSCAFVQFYTIYPSVSVSRAL